MPQALQKKSTTINIALQSAAKAPCYFANQGFVQRDGGFIFMFFGHQGSFRLGSEDVSLCIAEMDLQHHRPTLERYFAEVVDMAPDAALDLWRPTTTRAILAANVIQLARRGEIADTTFHMFSMHDTVVTSKQERAAPIESAKASQRTIESSVVLTVRSPIGLQIAFLKELLKL